MIWKVVFIVVWLGALAVLDLRFRRVPVWLLAVGVVFVTVVSAYRCLSGSAWFAGIFWRLLPGISMLTVAGATKKAGWADGIVQLLMGLLLNLQECAVCFCISLAAISVVSMFLLVFQRVNRNFKLPYLPFLWIGYIAQVMLG